MHETETTEVALPKTWKRFFPHSNIRNIRIFYWLTASNNAWFIAGNWIFFWTRFMTYGELGIVDASAFAFGLLMEIPSGAISDLFGKKKTIVTAMFLSAFSIIAMAFTQNLITLWAAFFVTQLGWALYSGAAEALAYDTLKEHKKQDAYEDVISSSGSIASIASITAILAGGILFVIHFRLTHLAWGLANFAGLIVSLKLIEPKIDSVKFSFKTYVNQLKDGTKQLFKPAIRTFTVVILALLGVDFLYNFGLIKPVIAIAFGFFDKEQAIIFASFGIIGALTVRQIPRFRKSISDKKGLYLLTLVMGVGFLLTYFKLGYFGLIPMFLIYLSGKLSHPWLSIVVNNAIDSAHRATTLSTVALITKIPYVVLAVVAGKMVEQGTFNLFTLTVGVVVILSIIVSSYSSLVQRIKTK